MVRDLTARVRFSILFLFACSFGFVSAVVTSQTLRRTHPPSIQNGRAIYNNGCIACHGSTGSGAAPMSTEFKRPETFPDFSRCDQTTPEPNANWKSVIEHGGTSRGFSPIMPAFGDLLSSDEIDDVVAYLRGFCTQRGWPRGELNLPRALVTEKAFPEDEFVMSTAVNASGEPGWTTDFIHEQSFGARDQIEVDVPWDIQDQGHSWDSHVGDITFGLKHVFFSDLRTGSILALQASILPPSGKQSLGGNGTTAFEQFASFDQLFPSNTWIQFQVGSDLPVDPRITPQSMFYYTAVGQTLAGDHRLGRQWSPMVEFLATRDLVDGAKTNWDVMPEMQVTLSKRQHVRADIGVRAPFANTSGRTPEVNFYLLWDWADGKLWQGWR